MNLYLVDTSVWIEWFRKTESGAARAMRKLREDPAQVAVTQPVAFEVRAGTKRVHLHAVDRVLDGAVQLSVAPETDFDVATRLYLAARERGTPVRSLTDCLIAAVAVRTNAVLVHRDRDFDVLDGIARDLRTWSTLG
ncbi:type II toxin-antitoxin system VapC family toxin [Actinophytocola gossypii]|uniref:Ribonuclease VapC n=1 Tax=Actinophytocola gossypii TaxID=2812003 RepID=A0ABT2JAQ9_9PSEU|nr:PIN domain-containing protein [Actinophytocola gossypii]MCT2584946.1 PIN domain-containing protein [Actinophytocola gossypii]